MRKYSEVICPNCKRSFRMPDDCGTIKWNCSYCGALIVHKGNNTSKLSELGKKIEYEREPLKKNSCKTCIYSAVKAYSK